MPILHPEREAWKLIVCGAIIACAGLYAARVGTVGVYLQKFKWLGLRQYTRHPSTTDRRMYQVIGAIGMTLGALAIAVGIHALVKR
jgi:hypothetical protein